MDSQNRLSIENQPETTPAKRVSRRDLIKVGAAAAAAGAGLMAFEGSRGPSTATPHAAQSGSEALIKTTCALCSSGCGLEVRVADGRAVKVEGDPLHPVNQGVCCLRGQCSLEMLYSPERIEHPRIQRGRRGSGDWEEVSWDEALSLVAERLAKLRQAGRPHALALVHGELRGQMRAFTQRFLEAYGSPNRISTDSLGPQAIRYATWLTQGINSLPVYDLNNAAYAMAFGGNLLETSRNVIASLGATAFMRRGRPQRGKLVAVHPRLSLTGVKADEWVPIRPGTYAALALGMANVIINSELYDSDFVRNYTFGFEDFEDAQGNTRLGFKRLVLEQYTLERAAAITGVASEVIARLAGEFATNRPAVAMMPTEPGELNYGNALFTAMAVHALNALVGSIDRSGGVLTQRFPSLADWPDYAPDDTAQTGMVRPRIDGAGSGAFALAPNAYQNLPNAILSDQPYPLEALLLLQANPMYDLPAPDRTALALSKVPFIASIAHTLDESAALADVILPAATFMEMWADDFMEGIGYAGVSLRRPVVDPVHDVANPGDILIELARRIGGPPEQALAFSDYLQVVRSRLAGAPLEWEKLEANGFWAEMVYFNAPPGSAAWNSVVGRDRLAAPKDGRFDFFPRELFAILNWAPEDDARYLPHFELTEPLEQSAGEAARYPLWLISQPLITVTSAWQGVLPTLQEMVGLQGRVHWQSWVEINPLTAEALHVQNGDQVTVESPYGRERAVVRVYPGLWPNVIFMPAGMGHHSYVRWGRNAPEASVIGSNPARLMPPAASAATEPISGQAVTGPVRVRIICD